ncbi:MAG: hypothetical protein WDN50_08840 [Bradyrhizobium sp.]
MSLARRLLFGFLCALVAMDPANAQSEFYRAPPSEAAGAPGTLVRQEVIDGAPLGATTYRVLYRSIGLDNKPILVSGVVIVPPGRSPAGRPADRGLGASDLGRGTALRAVAGDLLVRADPGAAFVRARRLCGRGKPIIPASARRARIPIS